jgi:DNA-binding transcriptional LysR family regulator
MIIMEPLTNNVDWLTDAARLRAFVAVVERGGFTRAAESLGVTQPTVSTLVAALERRLATPLLERSRSGVQPTAAGGALLPSARRILATAEQAGRSVIAAVADSYDHLTVAGGEGLVVYALPPAIAVLTARRPTLEITVASVDVDQALRSLREGQVDCVLATREVTPSDLEFHPVQTDPLIVVAHPDHPLSVGRHPLSALADVPLVTREAGRADRIAIDALLREAQVEPPRRIVVASLEGVKQTVMSGLGVALVPALAVAGDLERGSLALVGLRANLPTVEWGVVTTGRERSPVVGQLIVTLMATIHPDAKRPSSRPKTA